MTTDNEETLEAFGRQPRLGIVANKVLNAAASNPPPWGAEFNEWAHKYVGPRPTFRQGVNDWECVMLGAILAWGYLAAAIDEAEDESDVPSPEAPVPADSVEGDPAPVEPGADSAAGGDPLADRLRVHGSTFAVLGPDGTPVVEGLR